MSKKKPLTTFQIISMTTLTLQYIVIAYLLQSATWLADTIERANDTASVITVLVVLSLYTIIPALLWATGAVLGGGRKIGPIVAIASAVFILQAVAPQTDFGIPVLTNSPAATAQLSSFEQQQDCYRTETGRYWAEISDSELIRTNCM